MDIWLAEYVYWVFVCTSSQRRSFEGKKECQCEVYFEAVPWVVDRNVMLLSKEVSSEGEFDPHPKITPLKMPQTFTAQPQPEML